MAITDVSEGQTEETARLLTTRSVLSLDFEGAETVVFGRTREELLDGAMPRELTFEKNAWEEMGSPTKITIAIEPGDKLND